jgi:hypothetical protein
VVAVVTAASKLADFKDAAMADLSISAEEAAAAETVSATKDSEVGA